MKMKFSFFALVLLCDCCSSVTVNSFAEIEELYYARKLKSIQNRDTSEDDPYTRLTNEEKETQCKKALSTAFFTSPIRNEVYADQNDPKVFEDLSRNLETRDFLYDIIYENGSIKNLKFTPKYPYDKEFKVWFKGCSRSTAQVMFPCMAKHIFTGTLKPYFITYGFAEGEGFLFGHLLDEKLFVLALIEEAPISLAFGSNMKLQEFYVKQREVADTNPLLDDEDTGDPVCDLQDFEKARLCAVIFDSEFYVKKKIKFLDAIINVDYSCKTTQTIIFTESGVEMKFNVNSISCKVSEKNNEATVIYEVSQGWDGNNSVFTFKTIIVERPFIFSWITVENRFLELDAYIKDITVLRDTSSHFENILV